MGRTIVGKWLRTSWVNTGSYVLTHALRVSGDNMYTLWEDAQEAAGRKGSLFLSLTAWELTDTSPRRTPGPPCWSRVKCTHFEWFIMTSVGCGGHVSRWSPPLSSLQCQNLYSESNSMTFLGKYPVIQPRPFLTCRNSTRDRGRRCVIIHSPHESIHTSHLNCALT